PCAASAGRPGPPPALALPAASRPPRTGSTSRVASWRRGRRAFRAGGDGGRGGRGGRRATRAAAHRAHPARETDENPSYHFLRKAFSILQSNARAGQRPAPAEKRAEGSNQMSDALPPEAFIRDLLARIAGRRTFGGHPLWCELAAGKLSRAQLKLFAIQFFLQVREFPRAVSAMHANWSFPEGRMKVAGGVYQEETGRISGCHQPPPELFIRFGEAVGLSRSDMTEGRPLPATRALIDWFELSTKQRSFIEGAAAINLAAEGQGPGAFGPLAGRRRDNY